MKEQTLKNYQPASKQRGSVMLWGLLGLLGFVALAWYCVARHVPVLEQRLQTSVLSAIEPLSAGKMNVEMNGYAANISGSVQNSTVRDSIIAAAGDVPGVRAVNDNLQQLVASPVTVETPAEAVQVPTPAPEAAPTLEPAPAPAAEPASTPAAVTTGADSEPAEINISIADRTLTLTGRVLDQRELRPIVESAMTTFDLNYVSNKTRAADSIAPMEWTDGLVTTMPELLGIKNPSIDVYGQQITLGGIVASEADQQSIIESVQKNLPDLNVVNQLRVEGSEPAPTPVTPTEETAENSEKAEAEAEAEAAAAAAAAKVKAAEAARQAAIEEEFRIATQQRAKEAEAQATAESQTLAAIQAREAAKEAAKAKASAEAEREIAEEAAASNAIKAESEDPVATASQELSAAFAALDDTRILFQSNNAVFASGSKDRLDKIAELLNKYPTVPVGIQGHTDNTGNVADNLALSQLRANAVRDYLASKGISVFRLSSFGYGESQPITSNDTTDGRAANRRIEFSF